MLFETRSVWTYLWGEPETEVFPYPPSALFCLFDQVRDFIYPYYTLYKFLIDKN